jgi:carboxypeptidase C (cathepsin A)
MLAHHESSSLLHVLEKAGVRIAGLDPNDITRIIDAMSRRGLLVSVADDNRTIFKRLSRLFVETVEGMSDEDVAALNTRALNEPGYYVDWDKRQKAEHRIMKAIIPRGLDILGDHSMVNNSMANKQWVDRLKKHADCTFQDLPRGTWRNDVDENYTSNMRLNSIGECILYTKFKGEEPTSTVLTPGEHYINYNGTVRETWEG